MCIIGGKMVDKCEEIKHYRSYIYHLRISDIYIIIQTW